MGQVAAAAFFAFGVVARAGTASAEPTLIDVSDQPIIILQHNQQLQLTTWDRPQIAVDAGGDIPMVTRAPAHMTGSPSAQYPVPIPAVAIPGTDGEPVQLGAEEFPVQIPPGQHDTVRIQIPSAATVMIPANTAVLSVNGTGQTAISNYHGQLVAQQRAGPLVLRNVSGQAFVQNLRGGVFIFDSNFDRLRTRTVMNNMLFNRCNVKQIEATSVRGSIVYNDGSFQPGLARFETVSGHVALGVNGGANIAVRGQPGQIFQSFERPTPFTDRNGEANANVGGGGPLVNVVTQQGRVYLYDGSLIAKRSLPSHWGPVRAPLERLREPPPPPKLPRIFGR